MADPATSIDMQRLERRVDDLILKVEKVILIEERQAAQGIRIGVLEQRMAADELVTQVLEKTLSSWINRGIGVWIAAAIIFTLVSTPEVVKWFK